MQFILFLFFFSVFQYIPLCPQCKLLLLYKDIGHLLRREKEKKTNVWGLCSTLLECLAKIFALGRMQCIDSVIYFISMKNMTYLYYPSSTLYICTHTTHTVKHTHNTEHKNKLALVKNIFKM